MPSGTSGTSGKPPHNRGHPPDMALPSPDDDLTIPAPAAARFTRLTASAQRAYICLRRRRADLRYVPIIVTQLANECEMHRNTMRRSLARLRDAGLARQRVDHGQERWKLIAVKESV